MKELAQNPNALELVFRGEEILATRARTANVDGREDPLLSDAPLEVQFLVTRALELFVDDLVHLRAGLDERRRDDGEAASLFDIPRGAEEALRTLKGVGIHPPGEDLAGGGHDGVVSAGEAGDGVEQDHHVLLMFNQALGLLDDHFRHLHVPGRGFVEGAGDHFPAHRALHFRHLFRALIDEQHDQHGFRIVVGDGLRDVLQHQGFPRLRRRNNQAPLPLPDGRHQINDAGGEVFRAARAALEAESFLGKEGGEVLKENLVLLCVWFAVVDLINFEQREVALSVLRRTNLPCDAVAGAQIEAADLARGDVDVVGPGQIGRVRGAKEAEAVLKNLQRAVSVDVFAVLRVLA